MRIVIIDVILFIIIMITLIYLKVLIIVIVNKSFALRHYQSIYKTNLKLINWQL